MINNNQMLLEIRLQILAIFTFIYFISILIKRGLVSGFAFNGILAKTFIKFLKSTICISILHQVERLQKKRNVAVCTKE
jgi:hypothetical protein